MNASIVNGANLSTATMVFTSDFNLQSFGNVLSLTKPLLSVDEVVAGLENEDVVTQSLNTSSLNVDDFTTLNAVTIGLGLNSTNNNLFNINSSGTANFSSVNAEFINSSNVVNVSEIIGADCDFGSGYIQSFESELISASNMNLSNELNASVVNASQINASNIVGYQETLIAGTNISIDGNILSTTADANFSTVNASNLNALILFVEGYVSIGGIISAPLQPCFKLKCNNTTTSSVGTNVNYNGFVIDNHSGYNIGARQYVIPVAGNWFIYYGFQSNNVPFGVELQQNGTQRDRCQMTNINPTLSDPAVGPDIFNTVASKGNVILPCVVGDIIRIRVTSGNVRTGSVAEFSSFGGFMIG
jgi:hypothetical protein